MKVRVSAPSRLHLGMLAPGEVEGRRFGSIGVAIDRPRTVVYAEPSTDRVVEGPRAEDAFRFAEATARLIGVEGFKLRVESVAPSHVGLGSTTQLALACAQALARAYGRPLDPVEASRALSRGLRSGVGTYAFKHGGLVVDGGRGPSSTMPPLIARYDFPEDWCFLVVVPRGVGLHGEREAEAFRGLRPDPQASYRASYVALMRLIPALLERDLPSFARALSEIQELVGSMFAEAQGGVFSEASRDAIEALRAMGLEGVGQSSWGPTVYAVLERSRSMEALEEALRALPGCDVFIAGGDNRGARVEVEGDAGLR